MKKKFFVINLVFLAISLWFCAKKREDSKTESYGASPQQSTEEAPTENKPAKAVNDVQQNVQNSGAISTDLADIDAKLAEEVKQKKLAYSVSMNFKVKNVEQVNTQIWKITRHLEGYVSSANLQNNATKVVEHSYSTDSLTKVSSYTPSNQMVVRIPAQKLDSFLYHIADLYLVLEQQQINANDLTLAYVSQALKSQLFAQSASKMDKKIDEKGQNLEEITQAEQFANSQKEQKINQLLKKWETADHVHYASLNLTFHQEAINLVERIANPESDLHKPTFGQRTHDALYWGWLAVVEIIILLFKLWWFWILATVGYFAYQHNKNRQNK